MARRRQARAMLRENRVKCPLISLTVGAVCA
jgi:hypothetical protein